jgi:ryanodine receptor 2
MWRGRDNFFCISDRIGIYDCSICKIILRTMEKRYVPQPMDTSDVQLPEELNELVERMAKNVHEVWAQSRIEQGWVYGQERSDALKTHPCLIPYEDLPEIEKAYDRDTALGTLKLICKLGFKISK